MSAIQPSPDGNGDTADEWDSSDAFSNSSRRTSNEIDAPSDLAGSYANNLSSIDGEEDEQFGEKSVSRGSSFTLTDSNYRTKSQNDEVVVDISNSPGNVSNSSQPAGADADLPIANTATSQSPVMLFGTLVIIGAVATNVIGFRNSRFAVGKDVHRAWQNYEKASARRQYEAAAQRVEHERQRQQQNKYQQQQRVQWHAEADRMRKDQEILREKMRTQQTRADRAARESTKNQYRTWEQTTTTTNNDRRRTTRTTFENIRVDMDPNLFEALFGRLNDSKQKNQRTPFGMPEDVLEELLRSAQQQQQHFQQQQRNRTSSQQEFEFDAFKFWQHMNNTGAFHHGHAGPGADSRFAGMGGRNSPFGNVGMSRYYSALGLKEGASDADIKAAYRKEAMKWHPDRYRGDNKAEADRKFREVTEAYNALSRK